MKRPVVVITGANNGIGFYMTKSLLQDVSSYGRRKEKNGSALRASGQKDPAMLAAGTQRQAGRH